MTSSALLRQGSKEAKTNNRRQEKELSGEKGSH